MVVLGFASYDPSDCPYPINHLSLRQRPISITNRPRTLISSSRPCISIFIPQPARDYQSSTLALLPFLSTTSRIANFLNEYFLKQAHGLLIFQQESAFLRRSVTSFYTNLSTWRLFCQASICSVDTRGETLNGRDQARGQLFIQ